MPRSPSSRRAAPAARKPAPKRRQKPRRAAQAPHLARALDILTLGHRAPLPPALAAAAGEALARHRDWLGGASVQGMGIGERLVEGKRTGELVLKVYVDRKLPLANLAHPAPRRVRLPGIARAVEIDVEEIGRIGLEATTGGARSYAGGDRIGLEGGGPVSGTLGCFVRRKTDPAQLYFLSNAHVIADCGLAAEGTRVVRVGTGTARAFASYAGCVEFHYTPDGYYNRADAALARMDDAAAASAELPQIGSIAGIAYDVARGDRVRIVGAESGYTEGMVKDLDFRFAIRYPLAGGDWGRVGFRDQVLCSDYTREGDSGALVVDANRNAVGLHFAGSSDGDSPCSVFSPIGPVLAELGIEIVSGPAVAAPALVTPPRPAGAVPALAGRLAALTALHDFHGGVPWRLTANGLAVDGAVATTGGEPQSATRVWSTWGDSILRWATHFAVPVELIIATILTESGGKPEAVRLEPGYASDEQTPAKISPGLMQTLISTARDALGNSTLDRGWLLVPDHSIQAGAAYIAKQAAETNLDPPRVACAYNAGGLYPNDGPANRWRMRQYPIGSSEHADRFVKWFNDCFRMFATRSDAPPMSLYAALRA